MSTPNSSVNTVLPLPEREDIIKALYNLAVAAPHALEALKDLLKEGGLDGSAEQAAGYRFKNGKWEVPYDRYSKDRIPPQTFWGEAALAAACDVNSVMLLMGVKERKEIHGVTQGGAVIHHEIPVLVHKHPLYRLVSSIPFGATPSANANAQELYALLESVSPSPQHLQEAA